MKRKLYEIENKKNLSKPRIREIEKNLLKLENNLIEKVL